MNQYMQQNYYQNNNVYQQSPQQNIQKPKKKKKKHRFLKFLLFILIIIIFFKVNNKIAEKEFLSFVVDYPFIFNDIDCMEYVSDDFKVINVYETENKTYNTKWSSNSNLIKISDDGNVIIKRPEKSEKIVLTQTYKKFLGKAKKEYVLNIIGNSVINSEDIDVITIENLKNNEYNRDMQAVLNEDGSLQYMIGDFKNTYIYSKEDALVLIDAYKSEFNIQDNITFKILDIFTTDDRTTYNFCAFYDDMYIADSSIFVVVNNSNYKLHKLSMYVDEITEIKETNSLTEEEIKKLFIDYINNTKFYEEVDLNNFELCELSKSINKNGYISNYIVQTTNNLYTFSIQNNEIISLSSSFDYVTTGMIEGAGYNEAEEIIKFDMYYHKLTDAYYLEDTNRNILVKKADATNYAFGGLASHLKQKDNELWVLAQLVAIPEFYLERLTTHEVKNKTSVFPREYSIESETMYGLQIAYDYFYNHFNRKSFDNKGSKIRAVTNIDFMKDNAGWNKIDNTIYVGNPERWKYTTFVDPAVIVHEYTHGVAESYITSKDKTQEAINEAYADIFAYLAVPEANWEIGKNAYGKDCIITEGERKGEVLYAKNETFVLRDAKSFDRPDYIYHYVYPNKYGCENWNDYESHMQSLILSNVVYNLNNSKYFTNKTLSQLMFNSLTNGYDGSSTFLTFRRYVIKEAEFLKFEDEAIDYIAKCFNDVGLYDCRYVWKTNKFTSEIEEVEETEIVIESKKESVDGDVILDDTTINKYLIVYSPTEVLLGEGSVTIYEAKQKGVNKKEEEISKKLTDMFNTTYSSTTLNGKKIKIEYMEVNPKMFDFVENFSKDTSGNMINYVFMSLDKIGIDLDEEMKESIRSILENMLPYVFQWKIYETTAYDFYDTLGIIK